MCPCCRDATGLEWVQASTTSVWVRAALSSGRRRAAPWLLWARSESLRPVQRYKRWSAPTARIEDASGIADGSRAFANGADAEALDQGADAALDAARSIADASGSAPDAQGKPDAGGGSAATCLAPKIWTNHACGQWRSVPGGGVARSAVWANSPNDVWTVGNGGVISRWNGSTFVNVPSGVTTDLYGVWGTSSTDMWVVGASAVTRHWDGKVWESRPIGLNTYVSAIHGTNSDNIWAVGNGGYAHWTGASWVLQTSANTDALSLWMASSSFGVAGTYGGGVFALPRVDLPSTGGGAPNLSVWGTMRNDFWAGARNGIIFHFDGTTWNKAHSDSILYQRRWTGIWGAFADDVWVVGDDGWSYHWDGRKLTEIRISRDDFSAVSGTSAGDVWAVSAKGSVWRFSP